MKKTILFESFWFFLAQILGILADQKISSQLFKRGERIIKISPSNFSLLNFFITFSLVVILLLLILKFKKGQNIFFKLIFLLVVILGGEIFLENWLPTYVSLPILACLIFAWFRFSFVWIHNLLLILGIAGIGSMVGISLSPLFIIYLFSFVAIYDFIAVYKLNLTQKVAKSMVDSRALLGIIIPSTFNDFQKKITEIKLGDEKENFLILGGGDIIFPLMLSSSVIFEGLEKSLIIAIFSLLGLVFSYWLFLKLDKKPMPALPPLLLFCLIGYLFTFYI